MTYTWDNGIVASEDTGTPLNTEQNVQIMKREIEEHSHQLEDHQLKFVRGLPDTMTDKQFRWLNIYYTEATTYYPEPHQGE